MAWRNDSVQPQAWSRVFQCPHGSARNTLSLLTHYLGQQGIESAFKEKRQAKYSGAVIGQASRAPAAGGVCLHAALSHADLWACLHCPACCITHCVRADPGRSRVIALVLSSLAESPSLYRMSTKECPPPLSAPSLASPPISSQCMFVTFRCHLQCHTEPCILHTANNV